MDESTRRLVVFCVLAFAVGWLLHAAWDARDAPTRQGRAYSDLSEIADDTESYQRLRALTRYLDQLDAQDVLAALDGFESSFDGFDAYERNFILARIADLEPSALLERLRAWEDPELQKLASFAALRELISRGRHQAAVQYWESLPGRMQHLAALIMASHIAGEGHLDAATRFATSLKLETEPMALDRIAGILWRKEGASALEDWVDASPEYAMETISDPHVQRAVFQSAIRKLASHEPETAAAWAIRVGPEPYAAEALKIVATRWADRDPTAAIQWAAGLTPEQGRKQAVAAVLQRWGIRDHSAAARWLTSEEVDPELDPVVYELVRKTLGSAPAKAARWTHRIAVEEDRHEAQRLVARFWLRKNLEAATGWLESTSLPDDEVEALLEEEKTRRRRIPTGRG